MLRTQKLLPAEFYQYYSAEVEFMTLKFDRNTKYAHFLFPATIAERDGFLTSYINAVGYAVEIIYDGIPLEITNSIFFFFRFHFPCLFASLLQKQCFSTN